MGRRSQQLATVAWTGSSQPPTNPLIGVGDRTTPAAPTVPDRLSAKRYAAKTQSAQPA